MESLDESTSSSISHGIHVFHCPDELGIVAKLSECIASIGGNILNADVFVPEDKNVFYSRRYGYSSMADIVMIAVGVHLNDFGFTIIRHLMLASN
ncbi:formyltetrahydrofolate deformylase 2, mitochondrial-like isoform X2 [Coffea eugenioides]|uniref:formyltetrahydrofolate deformylase 2, mitochondrial-like isoform X2 n=1 Tax=Coffea eugenioides TaxID=49369 RepID=UPI000F6128D3|nr:formyltetrahydrofolate deformylase 2, mitochondrial-like isoform X2 [Coffea eugenioides]XP_027168922.1 formyltetrahydrofolate deformylase 2, mitochondrial-like isoform X2 [Coffea eugenioides]XP_027179717.1 formyltetrahydrofolate deformylase 2, mitochondrial-like isoform X2 [Coffea eugenioides]XP_027179769.1 formyltetrahydrofolate deformylase 2, mitochondrial-like isoform X2 [Coffea eugenioides]